MEVTKAQFSTIEVLVAIPMTRWKFWIVPCLAEGNTFATCLKMLVPPKVPSLEALGMGVMQACFYCLGTNEHDNEVL